MHFTPSSILQIKNNWFKEIENNDKDHKVK